MIEPNAHYQLYEGRGRKPDQAEQDWLRTEQDEQEWLRAQQEKHHRAAVEGGRLRHLRLVRPQKALEGCAWIAQSV